MRERARSRAGPCQLVRGERLTPELGDLACVHERRSAPRVRATTAGAPELHGRQHYRAHRCFPRMQERGGRRSRAGALLLIAPGGRLIGMDRDACLPARAAGARTGVRWTRGQGSWVGGRLGGSRVVRAPTAAGRVGGDEDLRGSARRRALSSRSGRRSCGALVPAVESIAQRPKPRRRVQRRAR
jgi:hypothetical protein